MYVFTCMCVYVCVAHMYMWRKFSHDLYDVCMRSCICTYLYICAYTDVYVFTYVDVCVYICTCACMCVCACAYIHSHSSLVIHHSEYIHINICIYIIYVVEMYTAKVDTHIHPYTTRINICVSPYIHPHRGMYTTTYVSLYTYGVATISRLIQIIGLFCRISSLL